MSEKRQAPYLLDESPLIVYPTLAVALGINKAIVFQQLHFLLNGQKQAKNAFVHIDDRWWVYNSYAEWQRDYFPWLSQSTLKGIFIELEKEGLIVSRQSVKNKSDRRKWYTIDYESWQKYASAIGQKMSDQPSDKKCLMVGQKMSDDSSDTSSENKESLAPKARKARPLFDLIAKESFNITNGQILNQGGRIGKVESWCKKHDVELDELEKFYPWYDRNNTGASRPRDVEKFAEHFLAFREEVAHRNSAWPPGYIPVAERTHPLQFVELVHDDR